MVEKVRPVLVLSLPFADSDRAVVTVVFHTTTLRGSQFEVKIQVPFLRDKPDRDSYCKGYESKPTPVANFGGPECLFR